MPYLSIHLLTQNFVRNLFLYSLKRHIPLAIQSDDKKITALSFTLPFGVTV